MCRSPGALALGDVGTACQRRYHCPKRGCPSCRSCDCSRLRGRGVIFGGAAGRCCRAIALPHPSRPRCGHTIGRRRRSGFPRSARSGGRRFAACDFESRKDVAAASRLRSRQREGLSGSREPASWRNRAVWRGARRAVRDANVSLNLQLCSQ